MANEDGASGNITIGQLKKLELAFEKLKVQNITHPHLIWYNPILLTLTGFGLTCLFLDH